MYLTISPRNESAHLMGTHMPYPSYTPTPYS